MENLRKLDVSIIGDERPFGISEIQYDDKPWKILMEWATQHNFEHTVIILNQPRTKELSVRTLLGKGKPYPILPQYLQELRSLCKECSEESQQVFNAKNHGADTQRSLFEFPGEYFYHGKYSWDTLTTKLQSPSAQYPLLSSLPPKAYICDIIYNYADCEIIVSVYKN